MSGRLAAAGAVLPAADVADAEGTRRCAGSKFSALMPFISDRTGDDVVMGGGEGVVTGTTTGGGACPALLATGAADVLAPGRAGTGEGSRLRALSPPRQAVEGGLEVGPPSVGAAVRLEGGT